LQGLSNTNYVKMVWNNLTGQAWNPQLGTVSISLLSNSGIYRYQIKVLQTH